jgi:phosphatidylserine decarboxylase
MSELTEKAFILLQHLVPQHGLSRLAGFLAENRNVHIKNFLIKHFIQHFNVNMEEAAEPDYTHYPSFNDFFTRALRENARPVTEGPVVVSPADGAISEFGNIEHDRILQAKNQTYSLEKLLAGNSELADKFLGGSFATIYLSPRDYHRVHMPLSGTLEEAIYVPGKLFSVNTTTSNRVEELFARNERLICLFNTEIGKVAVILVGAMIVAGIETAWGGQIAPPPKTPQSIYQTASEPVDLEKGAELGRFKLGSTVILLFEPEKISFNQELGIYSPVRMGELLGNIR